MHSIRIDTIRLTRLENEAIREVKILSRVALVQMPARYVNESPREVLDFGILIAFAARYWYIEKDEQGYYVP